MLVWLGVAAAPASAHSVSGVSATNFHTHLTSVNQGVGTSYYMPYEQAMNAALVDGRSDIFALGATLYHLLTGQVPFQGSTHEEIVISRAYVEAVFPRTG